MAKSGLSADDAHFTTFQTAQDGRVLYITFNNPPVNALSVDMMSELRDLMLALRENDSVAVIVFDSANPEFFIAHVDMNIGDQMDILGQLAAKAPEGVNVFQAIGELLRQQPQVTVVKLKGIARGGGAEFIAAADMTFAARETARIGQIEALMGIIPSGGGTQYLLERVGRNRALELVLTGDAVGADVAASYGWINRAIPAIDLDAFVGRLAHNIAGLPDGVIDAAKRIFPAVTPLKGYQQEETEWGALFGLPAARHLIGDSLQRGAQTIEGERDLEGLLRQMSKDFQPGDCAGEQP